MTFVERIDIFKLLSFENLKPTQIARRLNRNSSSITHEIKCALDSGIYNPFTAEFRHLERRKNQQPHLKMTSEIWDIVKPLLELRWSPEQMIAEWLKTEYPLHTMSGKTIYNYVFFHMKGELTLSDLRQHGKRETRENTGNDAHRQPSYRNKQP